MTQLEKYGLRMDIGDGWVQVSVRVRPRASQEGIVGVLDGALKVQLTAPPVEGKANRALQALLASRLGVSRKDVEIVSGVASRAKRVRLHGVTPEAVEALFGGLAKAPSEPAHG